MFSRDSLNKYLSDKFGFEHRFDTRVKARKFGLITGASFFVFTIYVALQEKTFHLATLLLLSNFMLPIVISSLFFSFFSNYYKAQRKKIKTNKGGIEGYSKGLVEAFIVFVGNFYVVSMLTTAIAVIISGCLSILEKYF